MFFFVNSRFAPREGNSRGLVVVVNPVVTRNKPKKIHFSDLFLKRYLLVVKKLENNIFVVTHSKFVVLLFSKVVAQSGQIQKIREIVGSCLCTQRFHEF